MKLRFPTIAVLFAALVIPPAGGFAMAKRPPATPPPALTPLEKQPKLVFNEMEFDFGVAKGKEKVEHVYTFRNEGSAELLIDRVKSTCGCTAVLLSAKRIPPGGTGEVKATFTFGARQGKQLKHIYVHSNDPSKPKLQLTLKGEIVPPVRIEPRSLHFFDAKASPSRTVTITQTLEKELELGESSTRSGFVEAVVSEAASKEGKKSYSMKVTVKPDLQPGRYYDRITIPTNAAEKPISIPVRITIRGDIEAAPRRVNLGAITPGSEVTRTVRLSHRRRQPFVIEKVEIDNAKFKADLKTPTEPKASHEVTLRFSPPGRAGTVRAKITFHTDYEPQEKVEVNAYGYIRKPRAQSAAHKPAKEERK